MNRPPTRATMPQEPREAVEATPTCTDARRAAGRVIENRAIMPPEAWEQPRWRADVWKRLRYEIIDALERETGLPFAAAIVGITHWQESDEPVSGPLLDEWAALRHRLHGEPLPRELRIRVLIETEGPR